MLFSAPAGYGKTTLLSMWQAQGLRPIAWLSLDTDDNDPARFLRYIIAALQTLIPDMGEAALSMLHTPQLATNEAILTLLLNDLMDIARPLALILDDYHVITHTAVHESLRFLLKHLPTHMGLILATRADPPFPLARMRGKGQLAELRATDLSFTYEETVALLTQRVHVDISSAATAELLARTQGWATGLHLATLAVQRTGDAEGFLSTFSGRHRYIAKYLADEVLDQQSPAIRDFLLKTAILDRLTASLCEAVTGDRHSQALVEQLQAENLFLNALDDTGTWYSYHPLFVDALRTRLHQTYTADQIAELHQHASLWLADAGNLDAAIAHAMATPDRARALALMQQHAETLWRRGEHTTLLKWLETFSHTSEGLSKHPRLRVYYALALVITGNLHTGARHLHTLEYELEIEWAAVQMDEGVASTPTPTHISPSLAGIVAAGRAYIAYYQRNVADMTTYAALALQLLPPESTSWRGGLAIILGNAHTHQGHLEAAEQAFSQALAAGDATQNDFLRLTASVHLAISHVRQGHLRRAAHICETQLSSPRLIRIPAVGTLHAIWGNILREWNHLEEAQDHVKQGVALCTRGGGVAMQSWSKFALINVLFSTRDFDRITPILQTLEGLSQAPPWVHSGSIGWKTRVWLAQGKLDIAAHMLQACDIDLDADPDLLHIQVYLAIARLRIAQGVESADAAHLQQAQRVLARVRHASASHGWMDIHIQSLILLALAQHRQGNISQGLESLHQALVLAEPEGFVRIFVDEGEAMLDLLRQAVARKDLSRYAEMLLHAAQPDAVTSQIEPLSARELEVLALIAEGLTNQEIGKRLFITTGTVKVHASHIYQKLGVTGRLQAVTWAKELGVL